MTPATLQAHRHTLKLTQRALASHLGISERQYIRYETGASSIPPPVAIIIDIMAEGKIPKTLRVK